MSRAPYAGQVFALACAAISLTGLAHAAPLPAGTGQGAAARGLIALVRCELPPPPAATATDARRAAASRDLTFAPALAQTSATLARHGLQAIPLAASRRAGLVLIHIPPPAAGWDPAPALAALRASGEFAAVAPAFQLRLFDTFPSDPDLPLQWYVDNGDSADVELPGAWDVARGDTATLIAVLDTGVDLGHPDLASQIWTNPGEIPGNGLDDDANNLVDDVHGWDFGVGDADPNPEPMFDEIGLDVGFHGTFCAGIAAAATGNGEGISGAGWHCRILPLKVSDALGQITSEALAAAILYAIDAGASIISMSLGAPGDPGVPEFFQPLMDAADSAGVLCVAAAGNAGADTPNYPAANDRVLAVAATDAARARAEFSNFGAWVDLAAPGAAMWSTLCRNYVIDDLSQLFYMFFFGWDGERPYMYGDGTSFACPLVAGTAGLVRARFPALTPAAVRSHLVATGDPIAFDQPIGPKLNAWRAVQSPPVAATAATTAVARWVALTPNPSATTVRLTFALPAAARVRVAVHDVAGRRVQVLADGLRSPGTHTIAWDGRDAAGRQSPAGVYLVRLETGGHSDMRRLVWLGR